MAWTAPLTAVDGHEFTAQQYNLYIRDNFLEMAPEKATKAGQYFVSTKVNEIAAREPKTATVLTSQTRTSTSYGDLSTVGPSVTVTHGKTVMVFLAAEMSNNTANLQCRMSVAATAGDNDDPANDKWCVKTDGVPASQPGRYSSARLMGRLTPGSTTFTAKYRVGGGTGTFSDRTIAVIPL